MPRRPAAPPERPLRRDPAPATSPMPVVVAGALTAVFVLLVGLFFTTTLPNNPAFSRTDILANAPDLLLLTLPGGEGTPNSGWRFLPQRLDLVAFAAAIWLAAWALGRLALRSVRLFERLEPYERNLWGCAAGIGVWSVVTLALGLAGLLFPWIFRAALVAAIASESFLNWRGRERSARRTPWTERRFLTESALPLVVGLAVAPFLLAMLLGAMLPPTDFDVREYHLEGPKEYFQAGRVQFLPHNVYTSFPFATEMLHLLGMVLRGDWYRGGLIGQTVLMGFAPLTAAGLFYAGQRWFSERAAWLAVLIWLTAPWTYRISTIAYTEGGLAAFLLLAFIATVRAGEVWRTDPAGARGWFLLAGFLAGNGPACKYPGAISVAIPMFALVVWTTLIRPRLRPEADSPMPRWSASLVAIVLFLAGGAIAFGPWLAKNLAETGNPFYPLMYSLFGGRDWDPVQHAKWQAGHPLPLGTFHGFADFLRDQGLRFLDAFLWNDWQTPLALAALPIAIAMLASRWVPALRLKTTDVAAMDRTDRMLGLLLLETFWLFETWCLLSHRIDRFWVPMLPILCWVAAVVIDRLLRSGEGRAPVARLAHTAVLATLLGGVTLYHLAFISSGLCGNNAWLLSEKVAAKQFRNASVAVLEDLPLPTGAKVLFVGEAEVFEARFENVYNTVFDRSIFEEWFRADPAATGGMDDGEGPSAGGTAAFKPRDEILRILTEHGITHVAVNWSEILRYRPTYTYTDFVHPDRFRTLVDLKILRRLPRVGTFREFDRLPDDQKREIARWAPDLVQTSGGKSLVPGVQVYEVVK